MLSNTGTKLWVSTLKCFFGSLSGVHFSAGGIRWWPVLWQWKPSPYKNSTLLLLVVASRSLRRYGLLHPNYKFDFSIASSPLQHGPQQASGDWFSRQPGLGRRSQNQHQVLQWTRQGVSGTVHPKFGTRISFLHDVRSSPHLQKLLSQLSKNQVWTFLLSSVVFYVETVNKQFVNKNFKELILKLAEELM